MATLETSGCHGRRQVSFFDARLHMNYVAHFFGFTKTPRSTEDPMHGNALLATFVALVFPKLFIL